MQAPRSSPLASKAALTNLAKSLSKEFGSRGVRVNTISPGPVETDLWLGKDGMAATAAIVNAIWDLWAKVEGKPLWRLVCDLSPEQFVGAVDFRYLTDAVDRDEALDLLHAQAPTKAARVAEQTAGTLAARGSDVVALHLKQEKTYQDLLELSAKEKDQAKKFLAFVVAPGNLPLIRAKGMER